MSLGRRESNLICQKIRLYTFIKSNKRMNTDELIFLTKSEAIKDVMNVIVVFM